MAIERLDVLRGIITDVTYAAKTSKPVTTDSQMISIIRKRVKSSEAAADEFKNAKRDDLEAREIAQINVLQEYVPHNTVEERDLKPIICDVIESMRTGSKHISQGNVLKVLFSENGALDGQLVDKGNVTKLVRDMI